MVNSGSYDIKSIHHLDQLIKFNFDEKEVQLAKEEVLKDILAGDKIAPPKQHSPGPVEQLLDTVCYLQNQVSVQQSQISRLNNIIRQYMTFIEQERMTTASFQSSNQYNMQQVIYDAKSLY